MTTSAIVPVTGVDFDSSSATASQQTVFNNLLNQLQQSVGSGDLTTSATLLNAIEALSPSAAGGSNPLGAFLTSLGTALNDGSVSEAQSALATYQNATPASAASTTAPDASTSASAANIAAGLIQSQIQLNLVTTLLNPASSSSNSSNSSANGSVNSLLSILTAAYPESSGSSTSTASSASGSSASGTGSSTSATPYDTLVSSIQASLAGGDGTLTPALAYLQASGNFVNTSA
jgi:hypothetical protein